MGLAIANKVLLAAVDYMPPSRYNPEGLTDFFKM
jgi:hypothetical protein